jgi:uncharacterized protein YcgL (UPF0745 family)
MPFEVIDNATGRTATFDNEPTETDLLEAFGSEPVDVPVLPDIPDESVAERLTREKKEGIAPTISTLEVQSLWEKSGIMDLIRNEPELKAKSQNSIAFAEMFNISPSQAFDLHDELSEEVGLRQEITTEEFIGGAMLPVVAAGLAMNPVGALLGIATFEAISEVESAVINVIEGEKYQAFQKKGLSDLLPEEASQLTTDIVDTLDFIGKGLLAHQVFRTSPRLAEKVAKEIITEHKAPKTIYIDPAELRLHLQEQPSKIGATEAGIISEMKGVGALEGKALIRQALKDGVKIEIPAERITILRDRPWFAKVKEILKIDPAQEVRTVTEEGVKTFKFGEREVKATKPEEIKLLEKLEVERKAIETSTEPEPIKRVTEIDKEISEITKPLVTTEVELKKEIKVVKEETPEKTQDIVIKATEDAFKRELSTIRDVVSQEPELEISKLGATKGFTNKEIAKGLQKAEQGKKLNVREKRILGGAISTAHERLSEQLARVPQTDMEAFIDNSITQIAQEHLSAAEMEKLIVSEIKKQTQKVMKGEVVTTEAILLRKRLRDEARGARLAERVTRKQMVDEFRRSSKNLKDTRKMLIDFIEDQLPKEAQGKFIKSLQDDLTLKKQASIFGRVEKLSEELTRKELVADIKKLKKPKGNIAVDYQKRIVAIAQDFQITTPTQKTIDKLTGLKEFIESNPDLNIPQKHIDKLDKLSKKPIQDYTTDELTDLRDTLLRLSEHGKLKQKLKNKYNERERQVALNRLLKSTRNIDPKLFGAEKGVKKKIDTFKRGGLIAYLNTLHTPRVADFIDGFRGYEGENAKLMKRLGFAETQANLETRTVIDTALQEIKDIGIEEITAEDQVRIAINLHIQQKAFEQAKTIMTDNGLTKVPDISTKEQELINVVRKHLNANVEQIAALSEELKNVPYEKVENYFPIKYKRDFNIDPDKLVMQTGRRTAQTFEGFNLQRQKGVSKSPRTDILAVFEEAINEQQWYLKMQPELENIKQLVKSKEYLEQGGEIATNYWTNQLDIVARRGWSAGARSNEILRQSRINLNQAILGYKLSSILMQPFAVFDAMAYAQSRYGSTASLEILSEFSKAWTNPRSAREFIKTSPALQTRQGGELAIEETLESVGRTEGFLQSFQKGGLSLLQKADLQTAAGVQKGVQNILEKNNIPDAAKEAEFVMNMVSGSAEVAYRPQILASGEGARTWFTFQTFFLNRWGIMAHDLIASGLIMGKTWQAKASALIGLGIFMAGNIAEEEAREFLFETVTGKELPEQSMFKTAALSIPSQVPYFGNVLQAAVRGGSSNPPTIRVVENIFRGGAQIASGIEKEDSGKIARGALKLTENALAVSLGVPGTAQAFDVFEGIFLRPEERRRSKRKKSRKKHKK